MMHCPKNTENKHGKEREGIKERKGVREGRSKEGIQ